MLGFLSELEDSLPLLLYTDQNVTKLGTTPPEATDRVATKSQYKEKRVSGGRYFRTSLDVEAQTNSGRVKCCVAAIFAAEQS